MLHARTRCSCRTQTHILVSDTRRGKTFHLDRNIREHVYLNCRLGQNMKIHHQFQYAFGIPLEVQRIILGLAQLVLLREFVARR